MSGFAGVTQHGAYNKEGAGVKADEGKLQWHLLPMKYLRGVVKVLMWGASKYSAHNWRAGMPWSQPYNALCRHLDAWQAGEDFDRETGESHLDHALCCLIFLRAFVADYPGKDDRYDVSLRPSTPEEIIGDDARIGEWMHKGKAA